MKDFFGLKEKDELVALVYLGYADMEKKAAARIPAKELTKWLDS